MGCGLSLDRRAVGVRGAALVNPHGLVQEFLNRSQNHLWAIVTNGLRFRILRDSQALSRQSYLEFDLESMFTGEIFSDFVLFWLTAHATRFAPPSDGKPEYCLLEYWTKMANEQGARALESLRGGVEKALQVLGQGFVAHPHNITLRKALRSGQISIVDFHSQLLRVVYRLIFLFVAEDRLLNGLSILHPRDNSIEARHAREQYSSYYGTARLRDLASRIKGSRHGDLWQQFNLIAGALSGDVRFADVRQRLALPALGSFLWSQESTSVLNAESLTGADGPNLTNTDFLEALRHLAFVRQDNVLRLVDYKNLGSEELGSVYESLLELHPVVNVDAGTFSLQSAGGHERKISGSYYTPAVLILSLLDTALEPALERAMQQKDAEGAMLNIKVCDPSCGSGHFLVAAAHRIARQLALVRNDYLEPSPDSVQVALRDVIGRCIYGADINPMAVELCKVNLWLEALDPGRPLSFLDHHIICGNSLIGATPLLISHGIPDAAFTGTSEDDANVCKSFKKRNKAERTSCQASLFDDSGNIWIVPDAIATNFAEIERISDATIDGLHHKEQKYQDLLKSSVYQTNRLVADAWCAAFLCKKVLGNDSAYPITDEIFQRIRSNPASIPERLLEEIRRTCVKYRCLHWHLDFPDVFSGDKEKNPVTGWHGGFDVVLGNPPWDVHEVRDSEFFAVSHPEIIATKTAKERKQLLHKVKDKSPEIWRQYLERTAHVEKERHFICSSGRFPYSACGSINLFKLFIENDHDVINNEGRVGIVIPSSFIADASSKKHFQKLHSDNRIASVYDLENYENYFSGTDRRFKFCLITISGSASKKHMQTDFVFWARSIEELKDADRHLHLSHNDLFALNPISGSAPVTRSRKDLELALHCQRKGVLLQNTPVNDEWHIQPRIMLSTEESSSPQQTYEYLHKGGYTLNNNCFSLNDILYFPVYEGKMVSMFDHRSSSLIFNPQNRVRKIQREDLTDDDHMAADKFAMPMFWIEGTRIQKKYGRVPQWSLGIKEITYVTNERTVIGTILPPAGLANTLIWLDNPHPAPINACLIANLNTLVLDYVARQKVAGLHLRGHYIAELPLLALRTYSQPVPFLSNDLSFKEWVVPRVVELVYTALDMRPFAEECGVSSNPFVWDVNRRFQIRCELDAAFFINYGITRGDVEYILETFPVVKRKDEKAYDEYRTRSTILSIYDAMQNAKETNGVYKSILSPLPADNKVTHQR